MHNHHTVRLTCAIKELSAPRRISLFLVHKMLANDFLPTRAHSYDDAFSIVSPGAQPVPLRQEEVSRAAVDERRERGSNSKRRRLCLSLAKLFGLRRFETLQSLGWWGIATPEQMRAPPLDSSIYVKFVDCNWYRYA